MAIEKKLIHFGKLADFEAQLAAGNILGYSIVFIQDANKIWTHGTYYDCSKRGDVYQPMVSITWAELKEARDNQELIPGQEYRITDYVTTTIQENTQSAGHKFDIIVTAIDESTLSEEAQAIQNFDEGYFDESNLSAWKIWYCLDNDTDKFIWADTTNGKGVIYRMIDEFNNDCPYDFKNIKFKRGIYSSGNGITAEEDQDINVFCYTFSWEESEGNITDASIKGNSGVVTDIDGFVSKVRDNVIKYYHKDYENEEYSYKAQVLNNIVFFSTFGYEAHTFEGVYDNKFSYNCANNTFGHSCRSNSFGNNCYNNVFGNTFCDNLIGNYCQDNLFGDFCSYNSFGDSCSRNYFEDRCCDNSFGRYCSDNSFGNFCHNNSFGHKCNSNSFGYYCNNNSFGNNCYENSFEYDCSGNSFGYNCHNNSFEQECSENSFENDCYSNSFKGACYNNSFKNECSNNSFGNNCDSNSFGNYCHENSFGSDYYNNSFGNDCNNNSFRPGESETETFLSYCYYNHFDDGCSYNVIWSSDTTSVSNILKNINVNKGVSGTRSNYNFINISVINSEKEINVNNYNGHIYVDYGDSFKITYSELVQLADNSQLIPGRKYRIIDYVTKTIQENTRSAEHSFDIIVSADDESTLNENAQAIHNLNHGYFDSCNLAAWELKYCLYNDTTRFAWANDSDEITYKSNNCTIKDNLINGNSFITPFQFESCVWVDTDGDELDYGNNHDLSDFIYEWGYFENELCLYKSEEGLYEEEGQPDYGDKYLYRGIVTVDGEQYDYWQKWDASSTDNGGVNGINVDGSGDYVYATTARIVSNPEAYSVLERHKGVIYYMKDEYGNEAPYDFKNIQFKRWQVTSSDSSLAERISDIENKYVGIMQTDTFENYMPTYLTISDSSDYKWFYTFSYVKDGVISDLSIEPYVCDYNIIKPCTSLNLPQKLNNIVIGGSLQGIHKNTFDSDCFCMTIGDAFSSNNDCFCNKFGQYSRANIFLGTSIQQNAFGENAAVNLIIGNASQNNIYNYFQSNLILSQFVGNTIGIQFKHNTIHGDFNQNTFGIYASNNAFYGSIKFNTFGGQTNYNTLTDVQQSSFGFGFQRNKINYMINTSCANMFQYNDFARVTGSTFGNGCRYNTSKQSSDISSATRAYLQGCHFGDYVWYVNLYNATEGSADAILRGVTVASCIQGSESNYISVDIPINLYSEIKIAKNLKGEIKVYCEADLIA